MGRHLSYNFAMRSLSVILICVCMIGGVVFNQAQPQATTKRLASKPLMGNVVCCLEVVPAGCVIPWSATEDKVVDYSIKPIDACPSGSMVEGQVTKFGLVPGQIVCLHDLLPRKYWSASQEAARKKMDDNP